MFFCHGIGSILCVDLGTIGALNASQTRHSWAYAAQESGQQWAHTLERASLVPITKSNFEKKKKQEKKIVLGFYVISKSGVGARIIEWLFQQKMETSLRYGGDSKALRIHAKEKFPIDSNTFFQVFYPTFPLTVILTLSFCANSHLYVPIPFQVSTHQVTL